MKMRPILITALLLVVTTVPALADKASVEDREYISASISNCIHRRDPGCSPNPFKTNSVEVGATVEIQMIALADWKSTDGTKHGQVFLSTKGCQLWYVGLVSIERALRPEELTASMGGYLSEPRLTKQVAKELVDELAQIEAQNIAYLRVPPGPSC